MSAAAAAPDADYPVPAAIAAHPAWFRLEGQRSYYSARAARYQDTYKHIKMGLIGLSASIPLLAFLPPQNVGPWIVAAAGIVIAVLEAMLLLNQYGPLWVKYRGTAESLKRERWLLLARAGEYAGLADDSALRLLAERVEALLDVEHREWIDEQKQALARLENTRQWLDEQRAQRDGTAGAAGAGNAGSGDAAADAGVGADGTGTGAGGTGVGGTATAAPAPSLAATPAAGDAADDDPVVAEAPLPGGTAGDSPAAAAAAPGRR